MIVFAIFDCGFRPRCARELDDGSAVRIDKLFRIIEECKFGVHDLSRTELDRSTKLPRFNMPLELGMFLAAKRFGDGVQKRKACLILDSEAHRYQKFISDISGQDVHPHRNEEGLIITRIRNFLRNASQRDLPGEQILKKRFRLYVRESPKIYRSLGHPRNDVPFDDQVKIITEWIRQHPKKR